MSALVNPTVWLVAALIVATLRSPGAPTGALLSGALARRVVGWPVLLALLLIAAANVGARGLIGHAVPGDFAQEVAAARSLASRGVLYSVDINEDVQDWLTSDPPPLASWWPAWLIDFLHQRQRQGRNRLAAQAHPPTLLLLFAPPILWFGPYAAYWMLAALSVLAAIVASQWLLNAWRPDATLAQRVLVAVALVSWQPTLAAIRDGQVSVLIGALAIGAWHGLRSGRPGLGGLSAGFATALKLYTAPLLALLAWRRSRAALYGIAVVVAAAALAGAAAGMSVWAEFAESARLIGRAFSPAPHNLAVVARVAAFVPASWLPVAYGVVVVAMCTVTGLALGRNRLDAARPGPLDFDFGIVLTLSLLLSPVAWHHYTFMLAQPLALMLVLALRSGRHRWVVGWAVATLVISLPDDAMRAAWALLPSSDWAIRLMSQGLVIGALWMTLIHLRMSLEEHTSRGEPAVPAAVALSS